MGRRAREASLEHVIADPLGTRQNVLITGGGGQLAAALAEEFPAARVLSRADWDVTQPPPEKVAQSNLDLVLHAAAWTDVDGAEEDPQGAAAANVGGTAHVASLGAPLVYFSSDYVFDGAKPEPYVESDPPSPLSAYGRSKLHGEAAAGERAWVVRTSGLFGWTSRNFVRTMLRLGGERDEVTVVDDQRTSPTYVGHLAAAIEEIVELPFGVYHVAADGECSWAEFAEELFEQASVRCRVRRITSEEWDARAPRPAHSVLRSERAGVPHLPHWRLGLEACLGRLGVV